MFTMKLHDQVNVSESHSFMSDSLRSHRLYSPWNSPGQNTGVGNFSAGNLPNPGIEPRDRTQVSHIAGYQLSHQGSPV